MPRTWALKAEPSFRAAAKALSRKETDEAPKPRRRGGETGKAFAQLKCRLCRRKTPRKSYAEAAVYLADTLDWLRLWDDNAPHDDGALDGDCNSQQNYSSPQP